MSIPESIQLREEEILKLQEKLNAAFWGMSKRNLKRKIQSLDDLQFAEVFDYLTSQDEIFSKLRQENAQLISNTDITFVVTRETINLVGS